jgi:hypothetical protein
MAESKIVNQKKMGGDACDCALISYSDKIGSCYRAYLFVDIMVT